MCGSVLCFDRTFRLLACDMHKKRIMAQIKLHSQDASVESAPSFASDAEIALAEQLRRQLEERLLGPSAAPSPLPARSDEDH